MDHVAGIQPGNQALDFIDRRIADPDYRGVTSSEHNRYDMAEIYQTLGILAKFVATDELIAIRTTDLSKRPINTPDEVPYAKFCAEVRKEVGKGTQDSIRKNIFVDLDRMGLIVRYDRHRVQIAPGSRSLVKYVSLSEAGRAFLAADLVGRQYRFTKAIDKLLDGYVETTLEILSEADYEIYKLTKLEFMFFVSAVSSTASFGIGLDECIELIKEYRQLARTQRRAIEETLKQQLDPKAVPGDKRSKRDWHNWKNKIDQIFSLFSQTPYFEVTDDDVRLRSKSTTENGQVIDVLKRSTAEKQAYLTNHRVGKKNGFELHHVIPLSWAEDPYQFKLFDNWQNMVYIDAYSHAQISQNQSRDVVMSAEGDDIVLSDYHGHAVRLQNGVNIEYDVRHQEAMLNYNQSLRESDPSATGQLLF